MSSSLGLSWVLSTISGYGIYGLQILLQYLRRGGVAQDFILTSKASVLTLPPLQQARAEACLKLSEKVYGFLRDNPQETLKFKHAFLHGCSSDFWGFPGQDRVLGSPNVACAAIEHLVFSDRGKQLAKSYDMYIAISQWNADFLKSLDIGPVHLCYQGIDPLLFYPGPSSGLYKDRFVIFSGGKFEHRKAQDIVVAAFKRFYERHPDALLVTCWQSLLKPDAEAFVLAGNCDGVPQERADKFGMDVTPWMLRQGLPPESFVDLPFTHNLMMPSVLHDCDMAVFPNRCEGGTNLVAMEAMACGIPTYVSYNTGQRDLVDRIGCGGFKTQRPVKASSTMKTVEGWGETDVDEVVQAMEYVYAHRQEEREKGLAIAARMKEEWAWGTLNDKLLDLVWDGGKKA